MRSPTTKLSPMSGMSFSCCMAKKIIIIKNPPIIQFEEAQPSGVNSGTRECRRSRMILIHSNCSDPVMEIFSLGERKKNRDCQEEESDKSKAFKPVRIPWFPRCLFSFGRAVEGAVHRAPPRWWRPWYPGKKHFARHWEYLQNKKMKGPRTEHKDTHHPCFSL